MTALRHALFGGGHGGVEITGRGRCVVGDADVGNGFGEIQPFLRPGHGVGNRAEIRGVIVGIGRFNPGHFGVQRVLAGDRERTGNGVGQKSAAGIPERVQVVPRPTDVEPVAAGIAVWL